MKKNTIFGILFLLLVSAVHAEFFSCSAALPPNPRGEDPGVMIQDCRTVFGETTPDTDEFRNQFCALTLGGGYSSKPYKCSGIPAEGYSNAGCFSEHEIYQVTDYHTGCDNRVANQYNGFSVFHVSPLVPAPLQSDDPLSITFSGPGLIKVIPLAAEGQNYLDVLSAREIYVRSYNADMPAEVAIPKGDRTFFITVEEPAGLTPIEFLEKGFKVHGVEWEWPQGPSTGVEQPSPPDSELEKWELPKKMKDDGFVLLSPTDSNDGVAHLYFPTIGSYTSFDFGSESVSSIDYNSDEIIGVLTMVLTSGRTLKIHVDKETMVMDFLFKSKDGEESTPLEVFYVNNNAYMNIYSLVHDYIQKGLVLKGKTISVLGKSYNFNFPSDDYLLELEPNDKNIIRIRHKEVKSMLDYLFSLNRNLELNKELNRAHYVGGFDDYLLAFVGPNGAIKFFDGTISYSVFLGTVENDSDTNPPISSQDELDRFLKYFLLQKYTINNVPVSVREKDGMFILESCTYRSSHIYDPKDDLFVPGYVWEDDTSIKKEEGVLFSSNSKGRWKINLVTRDNC